MTRQELAAAVEELSAIPYFPQTTGAKLAIAVQLGKFVENNVKLRWLVDAAVNAMTEWKGVPELRGLYCTRYKPSDGIEGVCMLPGYAPEDCEAQFSREIYSSPWKELPAGNPFDSDIISLAENKKLK